MADSRRLCVVLCWQTRATPATVIAVGSVKARCESDPNSSAAASGAAATPASPTATPASPTASAAAAKKPGDSRPNTVELSGGVLKMDLIRFAVESKEAVDSWLQALHLAHIRLIKVTPHLTVIHPTALRATPHHTTPHHSSTTQRSTCSAAQRVTRYAHN